MAEDEIFQHFVDQLLPYYYDIEVVFPNRTCPASFVAKGVLTENLFSAIFKTFYVLDKIMYKYWLLYLNENIKEAISSKTHYVLYVIRPCYVETLVNCDIYETFISVCALIISIGTNTYIDTGKNFCDLTPIIMTIFFENVLKEDFNKRGGWNCLERYLLQQDYVEYYETISDFFIEDPKKEIPQEFDEAITEICLRRVSLYSSDIIKNSIEYDQFIDVLAGKVISSAVTSFSSKLLEYPLVEGQSASISNGTSFSYTSSKLSKVDSTTSEADSDGTTESNGIDVKALSSDLERLTLLKKIKTWFETNGAEAEKSFSGNFHSFILGVSAKALQGVQHSIEHLISTFDALEVHKDDQKLYDCGVNRL